MIALWTLIALFGELWLLIELGSSLGAWPVLAWVAVSLWGGLWLVRRQSRLLARGLAELDAASRPAGLFGLGPRVISREALARAGLHDALLLALAGALFAIPGVASDVVAALLFVPWVRRAVATKVLGLRPPPRPEAPRRTRSKPRGPVVRPEEVEVIPPGRLPSPFVKRPKVIDVD